MARGMARATWGISASGSKIMVEAGESGGVDFGVSSLLSLSEEDEDLLVDLVDPTPYEEALFGEYANIV